jgi:hypothetical protein
MGAQIVGLGGNILTVKVTGRLVYSEHISVQRAAAEILKEHGPLRLLILTEDFQGWAKGGDWGDLSFQIDNDPLIEKMAIVADEDWEDLVLLFSGRGLRSFPIEHFPLADEARARAWLAA